MLRTNSKKAITNIQAYVFHNENTAEYYNIKTPDSLEEIASLILDGFRKEVFTDPNQKRYFQNNEYNAFVYWCSGLPSLIDTCYYYNRSAVDDLAAILEESEPEKAKYNERDAEKLLTWLIYRELTKLEKAYKKSK